MRLEEVGFKGVHYIYTVKDQQEYYSDVSEARGDFLQGVGLKVQG